MRSMHFRWRFSLPSVLASCSTGSRHAGAGVALRAVSEPSPADKIGGEMSGPIAVVADRTQAAELTDLLGGASSRKLSILAPRPFAPFTRAYTHAALAVVAAPRAMPAAVLASRVFRVPWVAAAPRGVSTRVLFQAAAVLAAPDELDDARRSSQLRVVLRDDEQRLRSLIDDLALSEDARGTGGSMLSRALANGWVFLNDRLTRVAIRLVPVTRKFPEPIHPKHLIDAPWHFWYDTDLQAGDRVLDVGCGSGEHAVHAAARVRSVLGIDVDARRLELAARLAGESGVDNVEFRRGDLTDAETFDLLRREPFDAVLLLDILEHLAHRGERGWPFAIPDAQPRSGSLQLPAVDRQPRQVQQAPHDRKARAARDDVVRAGRLEPARIIQRSRPSVSKAEEVLAPASPTSKADDEVLARRAEQPLDIRGGVDAIPVASVERKGGGSREDVKLGDRLDLGATPLAEPLDDVIVVAHVLEREIRVDEVVGRASA